MTKAEGKESDGGKLKKRNAAGVREVGREKRDKQEKEEGRMKRKLHQEHGGR